MAEDVFVDSGGVRIAVRDYGGDGVPVVLVHGHYGNLGSFDHLGPLLADSARVVAYDQELTGVEVQWFPTGHWISAEDTAGVARTVAQFLDRI